MSRKGIQTESRETPARSIKDELRDNSMEVCQRHGKTHIISVFDSPKICSALQKQNIFTRVFRPGLLVLTEKQSMYNLHSKINTQEQERFFRRQLCPVPQTSPWLGMGPFTIRSETLIWKVMFHQEAAWKDLKNRPTFAEHIPAVSYLEERQNIALNMQTMEMVTGTEEQC